MFKFKSMTAIIFMLFLTGCATVYHVPENAPYATVGVYENDKSSLFHRSYVVLYENDFSSVLRPSEGLSAAWGHPFKVQAGKLITIDIMSHYYRNNLFFPISFIPKADYAYFIKVSLLKKNNLVFQQLTLLGGRKNENVQAYTKVPFIKRDVLTKELPSNTQDSQDSPTIIEKVNNGKYSSIDKSTEWIKSESNKSVPAEVLLQAVTE